MHKIVCILGLQNLELTIKVELGMNIAEKLLKIYKCIDETCNSSVKLFDASRGHTSRSVGTTAYEERQKRLFDLAEERPDIIELLCKKGGHYYFKFEGQVVKIISSTRDPLGPNVFLENAFEGDELDLKDALRRIIFKADYDTSEHDVAVRECYYIEVDRNTGVVTKDIDILALHRHGYVKEVTTDQPKGVELPMPGLLPQEEKRKTIEDDTANDR